MKGFNYIIVREEVFMNQFTDRSYTYNKEIILGYYVGEKKIILIFTTQNLITRL